MIARWSAISSVPHEDGKQQQLWAEGARVSAWAWSDDRQRWEREDGLHWSEGEDGPTHWCPMAEVPVFAAEAMKVAA